MENALLIGMTRQMTLRREMDVIANNLANMNTNGFKAERMMFEEYLMPEARHDAPDRKLIYVQDWGQARDLRPGRIETTGNDFDLAIDGEGYFTVQTDAGVRFTRNGHFTLDSEGRLVTSDGHPVLGAGNQELSFAPEDGPVVIANDGTISTDAGEQGRLGIVRFDNPHLLEKTGTSLLATEEAPLPADNRSRVVQGALEKSNVEGVVEMTGMIEVMRAYSSATKLVEDTADLKLRALRALGRPAA